MGCINGFNVNVAMWLLTEELMNDKTNIVIAIQFQKYK